MDEGAHPYVILARRAIEHFVRNHELLHPLPEPDDPPPVGLFVSIHEAPEHGEQEGRLRGCIGSTVPTEPTLRGEIAHIAVSAAVSDPRFPPLTPEELSGLDITVYLLDEPEPISDISELDPAHYGVVLKERHGRTGLLLPGIPGISTPEQQVAIARQKGGFRTREDVTMYRFAATILR
jgi:AmmeMemoRadiSam system protein A